MGLSPIRMISAQVVFFIFLETVGNNRHSLWHSKPRQLPYRYYFPQGYVFSPAEAFYILLLRLFRDMPDHRMPGKVAHTLHDILVITAKHCVGVLTRPPATRRFQNCLRCCNSKRPPSRSMQWDVKSKRAKAGYDRNYMLTLPGFTAEKAENQ